MSRMEVSERFSVVDHHHKEFKSDKRKKKDKRKDKESLDCSPEASVSVKREKGLGKERKEKKPREDSPSNPRKKSRKANSERTTEKSRKANSERTTEKSSSQNSDRSTTNVHDKDDKSNVNVDERITELLPDRQESEEMADRDVQGMEHNPLHSCWTFKPEEIKTLKDKGVKIKMGQWSQQEVETLKINMEEYLKENGLTDPSPLIYRKDHQDKNSESHAKRTQFYQRLAKGINRPLFNIYQRVVRMFDPKNYIGRWSESDCNDLLRYHARYGDQWTKIGKLLGRSGMAVNHKYLILQKTPGYCKWFRTEMEQLSGAVRAATNTDFDTQISGAINWTVVSNFVGTRTPEQCRTKWLRDVCWVNVHGDKKVKWNEMDDIMLIERLYSCAEADENDVDWVKMSEKFPNSPSNQWLRLRWFTLKKAVPNFSDCDFEELLDYLHNVYRPSLMRNTRSEEEDNMVL